MHYCLTRRSDTAFWREVARPERINDRLRAKFEYWKLKPPSGSDFEDQFFPGMPVAPLDSGALPGDHRPAIDTAGLWGHTSYEAILYGMDFLREQCDEWYGERRPKPRVSRRILDVVTRAKRQLPPHDQWLINVLGMRDYANRR